MNVTVVVPCLGRYEIVHETLFNILSTTGPDTNVIAIDSCKDQTWGLAQYLTGIEGESLMSVFSDRLQVWCEERIVGIFEAIRLAADLTEAEVVAIPHSDVLFWKERWDEYLIQQFQDDPKLGLAGTAGAAGLAPDGGRLGTITRLIGKQWGGNGTGDVWKVHGGFTPDEGQPAAVLDGLVLIFRRETIPVLLDMEYRAIMHWYDREVSCAWNAAGLHVRTVPIEMDHFSGASGGSDLYYQAALEVWKKVTGQDSFPSGATHDQAMYRLGEERWYAKWGAKLPLIVGPNYEQRWGR